MPWWLKRVGWADTRQKAIQTRVTERKNSPKSLFGDTFISVRRKAYLDYTINVLPKQIFMFTLKDILWISFVPHLAGSRGALYNVRPLRAFIRCRSDRADLRRCLPQRVLHGKQHQQERAASASAANSLVSPSSLSLSLSLFLSLSLSHTHTHTQRCSIRQWIVLMSRIFPMNQFNQFTKPIWMIS